jgi:hypothetical protein
MSAFSTDFWHTLPRDTPLLSYFLYVSLLPVVIALVFGQLLVSSARALRKISFVTYGLSFHSRYAANIHFTTNAVRVIGNGYDEVAAQTPKINIFLKLTKM